MKKFFTIFFVSLGVVFFCIILALAYFWIADPYNIKPYIFQPTVSEIDKKAIVNNNSGGPSSTSTSTDGGGLTEGQQNALELVGIDPAVLPERLTEEQEQCFVQKFGQARVDEIKAGAVPSATEVLTGKSCL